MPDLVQADDLQPEAEERLYQSERALQRATAEYGTAAAAAAIPPGTFVVPELDMVPDEGEDAYVTASRIGTEFGVRVDVLRQFGPADAAAVVQVMGTRDAVMRALRQGWAFDDTDMQDLLGGTTA